MNLTRIYLIAILLLAFGVGANGQEPPKAVLVDEHGLLPCDDTLGRLDNWYSELNRHPNSIGLAVISGRPEEKVRVVYRQSLMQAYAKYQKASETLRFKYVRANSPDGPKVKLWRIPLGSHEPEIQNIDSTFSLPDSIKPFMLGREYPHYDIDFDICPSERSDQRIFASFLHDNPSATGNIVVREYTLGKAQLKGGRILRSLKKQFGIPRSRLRVFPRKRSIPANNNKPIVEYWYLP